MATQRRRLVAALLNVLFPGSGHLYAGRTTAAFLVLAGVLLSAHLMVVVGLHPAPKPFGAVILWTIPLGLLAALFISGWRAASRAPSPFVPTRWNRWWSYCAFILVALLLLNINWLYLVRPQLRAFRNPSGSMEPTLLIGDFFYMAAGASARESPSRNEIVVFDSVEEPGLQVLKRIVGLPGDTLSMTQGQLYRNHAAVAEPFAVETDPAANLDPQMVEQVRGWQRGRYLTPMDSVRNPGLKDWGPFVVPTDSIFVLGDNRDASYDSRFYGFVPIGNILGRPKLIYYSFDALTKRPWPFLTAIRWSRLGTILSSQ
jgi:signal peptidase I